MPHLLIAGLPEAVSTRLAEQLPEAAMERAYFHTLISSSGFLPKSGTRASSAG
jgi:hypothetical protein